MKNPFGKTRKVDNPYFTLSSGGWTWKVLKLYKSPEASLKDPYSRAFCDVSSPFTYGGSDLGDVYVRDVPGLSHALKEHSNV